MDSQIIPHGQPVPEGWKPLVNLQMPDGRMTTSRTEAQSQRPVPDDEVERNIRVNTARGLKPLDGIGGLGPDQPMLPNNGRVMALAGYGPSLNETWENLRTLPPHVDLWTTSGAYNFLTDRGIVPAYHTDVDPREHKTWLLRDVDPRTVFYLPSRANPGFFTKVPADQTILYHLDVKEERNIIWEVAPEAGVVPPAITAGLCAVRLGLVLGYRTFVIFGMDGSYRWEEGEPVPEMHAGGHPNGGEGFSKVAVKHPVTGEERYFVTSMLHLLAVDDYFVIAQPYPVGTFRFVGDGLLPWVEQCAREGYSASTGS